MKIEAQREIWTTREKQEIPICEMSDTHLINALAMLKRNALNSQEQEAQEAWSACAYLSDFSEIEADSAANAAERIPLQHWTRWGSRFWVPMFKEALRRGGDVAQRAVEVLG